PCCVDGRHLPFGLAVWMGAIFLMHGGSVACTACTVASQQEGHGFDTRMGSPQVFSAQVGYLPGLSVWSLHVLPVFTRGFLHQEPQQTNMQKEQNTPVRP